MLFWGKKKILNKKRVQAVNEFKAKAVEALEEMGKEAKDKPSKAVYSRMLRNVKHTPIYFYPKRHLRENVFRKGRTLVASAVEGEHVNVIHILQKGSKKWMVKTDFINLPAKHMFSGNSLTIGGIFTLSHEYAHFPKPALRAFAKKHRMSLEQAEELMADALSARLAVKMGFPREHVLEHFRGRQIVYGAIPFKRFIWNAVNS